MGRNNSPSNPEREGVGVTNFPIMTMYNRRRVTQRGGAGKGDAVPLPGASASTSTSEIPVVADDGSIIATTAPQAARRKRTRGQSASAAAASLSRAAVAPALVSSPLPSPKRDRTALQAARLSLPVADGDGDDSGDRGGEWDVAKGLKSIEVAKKVPGQGEVRGRGDGVGEGDGDGNGDGDGDGKPPPMFGVERANRGGEENKDGIHKDDIVNDLAISRITSAKHRPRRGARVLASATMTTRVYPIPTLSRALQ